MHAGRPPDDGQVLHWFQRDLILESVRVELEQKEIARAVLL